MAGNFIEGNKAQLRLALEAERRALSAQEVYAKGSEAQRCLAALSSFQQASTVALYGAQAFEVSTDRLWTAPRVCCPRVNPGSRVLTMHLVASPDHLVTRGKSKLLEPPEGAIEVSLDEIDCWVVPGVGFTARGDRLGRGGGYYDATLARARGGAAKLGLAFACQVVDKLPTLPHDVRVDHVVTELGVAQLR